jgi:hypothetical protein
MFNCSKKDTKNESMKMLQAYCSKQESIPKPLIFILVLFIYLYIITCVYEVKAFY